MSDFEDMLQRRNEALTQGGKKYDDYCKEVGADSSNPLVKEASRHKAILCWTGSTKQQRSDSRNWLKQHGFAEPPGAIREVSP